MVVRYFASFINFTCDHFQPANESRHQVAAIYGICNTSTDTQLGIDNLLFPQNTNCLISRTTFNTTSHPPCTGSPGQKKMASKEKEFNNE